MAARSAARSAGGAASGAELEASAYTLTFRADDGSGVPSGLAEAEVEVDFGEQHDRENGEEFFD